MSVGKKMAAKSINPIPRRPHEIFLFSMVFAADRAGVLRHMRGLESLVIVKNGRIKTAMVIGIRLDIKFVGEQPAAVAEQDFKDVAVRPAAGPGGEARLQIRRQPKAENQQR